MNAQWFNTTPQLPSTAMQYMAVHLGWGLLLATLLLLVARRWTGAGRLGNAVLVLLLSLALGSCFLPGALSPANWLGLAFQAPSLCTTLICLHLLRSHWRIGLSQSAMTPAAHLWPVMMGGLVLGWLLLLDTLALLPVQLYALGFHPMAAGLALLLGLWPCIMHGEAAWRNPFVSVLPAAVVVFVLSRWPSGNAWDAVLDPWLWIFLNGFVISGVTQRGRRAQAHA